MLSRAYYISKAEILGQLSLRVREHSEQMHEKVLAIKSLFSTFSSQEYICSSGPSSSIEENVSETDYCLCGKPSYGEMVECEDPYCILRWFHLDCVGLSSPPSGPWVCPVCVSSKK